MMDENKKNDRNTILLVVGAVFLGIAAAVLLFGGDLFSRIDPADLPQIADSGGTSGVDNIQQVGEPAYDFTLQDLDGNAVTLSELQGRPVILNFWATWCAPCRIEMPEFQSVYENYPDGEIAIVAVNLDEPVERVTQFFRDDLGLTFTALLDEGGIISDRYGVFSYPTTYFINEDGVVTAVHRGSLTEKYIEDYLADATNQ